MSGIAKTACPGGGLYVVEGELNLLMTAMRRGTRWSSHSHQDEDQDALMKGLSTLRETLNEVKELSLLEPTVFFAPFLEIIRSEETTGLVTSCALSAVNKFISYSLLDPEHVAIAPCVEAIADAVTHARFVGTDASGDGVVLMRILQVLRCLMLSPAGDHLSNESVCEIMLSCFRICLEPRLSDLLRKTAEHCLRDMVQHLFTKLPHFVDDTRMLLNMKKMRTNNMESTRTKKKIKSYTRQKSKTNIDDIDENEASFLTTVDKTKSVSSPTSPVSPVCNIVDMQGSLNNGTTESNDDKKSDNNVNNETIKSVDDKNLENQDNNKQHECKEDSIIKEETKIIDEKSNSDVITEKEQSEDTNVGNSSEECHVSEEKKVSVEDSTKVTDTQDNQAQEDEKSIDSIQSPIGSVEDLSIDESAKIKSKEPETVEEYVNTHGVRFMPIQQHAPYGALCVRELFRFLGSLCSPLDKQNTEAMTHLGLNLLQVALEIAADAFSNFPSLLMLVKDDLCRNLILLLGTDKLHILSADLQVSFLLFESLREHLKFQMEHYITKLMEIISSDSNRISYEQRELSLEAIVRLWRVPGLPAELYLNYDCGLYSTNLYEELMKLFSKNASSFLGGMYSMQFISLDAILLLISNMEMRCKGYNDLCKHSRHISSSNLPTRDDLLTIKSNKRWLMVGTEKFNENPREGIAKLAEHELLGGVPGQPDPEKIAKLLRENPGLDKKAIGEYISKKENKNILNCFVHQFDLRDTRIDQALRLYLESFRLPGEAPLISLLLEKFADHWHDSNNKPFSSADAAFTLAYAVIMLNVDQHNYNAKRQSNPMTAEEFKKNLKKVNGGADFDQDMLDEIYTSIKGEEIVMPAEQTGLVKDNYLWKVLLRRGASSESFYLKVGSPNEYLDRELAQRAWAPIISALCRAYDKAPDRSLQRRVAQAFLSCAAISAHYGMTSDFDTLIVSLCKFTGLAMGNDPDQIILHLGNSRKCQLAARCLFKITHLYGNGLRASWKNIVDYLQSLYKARLLPKELTDGEDFVDPVGKVSLLRESATPKQPPADQGILSSLYSYIALDTRSPNSVDATAKERAIEFVSNCNLNQIVEESKFLQVESLLSLVGALVSVSPHDEDISVFLLELLLNITIQNRDRVMCIWSIVQAHLDGLLTTAARENYSYLLERVAVGMLRLAIRLLRGEEYALTVLTPLIRLTHLPSATHAPLARQIAFGLFQLLKTGAANIHTTEDWKVIFSLLECAGAGALSLKQTNPVLDETNARGSVLDTRPISPVPEWVLVSPTGTEAPLPVAADTIVLDRDLLPHDPIALVKSVESLMSLVRDAVHVTPFNFELCIRCVRTFAEAVLICAGKKNKIYNSSEESPSAYQQSPIQLLKLMHTLHTRTAQVFRWWEEEGVTTEGVSLWPQAWRPLLQGIARLCCDARRPVRTAAITYLQSTLLAHDLAQLTAVEWSQCLEHVLFPLLAQLLSPIVSNDPIGIEETRVRAAMLLSKVFLHHLTPLLTLPGFLPLWLTVLDLLRSYMHADNSELLFEAIPESLKNMLLVMSSANVLEPNSNLWSPTWRTIDAFLPSLKAELFPEPPPPPPPPAEPQPNPQVISLIGQQQPSFPRSIAPQPEGSSPVQCQTQDTEKSVNPTAEVHKQEVEIVSQVGSVSVPITLPPLIYETKEPQHVITLVSQPPPSVSSPVAIQPAAQQVFDVCQSLNRSNFDVETQSEIERLPSDGEVDKFGHMIQSENKQSGSPKNHEEQIQQSVLSQQLGSQNDSSKQSHVQYAEPTASPQQREKPSLDSAAATMFNSAAYFNEDPVADRLFIVTNP